MKFRTLRRSVIGVCLILFTFGTAHAQDLTPVAFYGTFQGSGFAEDKDSIYFGTTVRDLDVIIAPTGSGFSVTWTTIIRGGGDPAKPNVRRKTQTATFSPTESAGVFRGAPSGDPLAGNAYTWARIEDNTMTVFILSIDKTGQYNMQSYARTLSGYGMDLVFSRIRDGEPVRTARAKLIKAAN
ncbi:MAG: hypothetical protein GKS00_27725 [Alphaproteobacteria bacterium]|nr:hypothetical protein [Alphaproteobacteria bacterium]